jgi:hypothetical protein
MADDGGKEIFLARRPADDRAQTAVAAGAGPGIGQLPHQAAPFAACCLDLLAGRQG